MGKRGRSRIPSGKLRFGAVWRGVVRRGVLLGSAWKEANNWWLCTPLFSWYARMRTVYGSQAVQERAAELKTGPADLDAYSKVAPDKAARLRQLEKANGVMITSAVAGGLGSIGYAWRLTRYVPFAVATALIAPVAFGWIGDNVATSLLGTWKWDNLKAVEEYQDWVAQQRTAGAGAAQE